MSRLVISQTAISKSICGNLNRRLKKRGMREPSRRDEPEADADPEAMPPKDDGAAAECCRGREMCGFMADLVADPATTSTNGEDLLDLAVRPGMERAPHV
jgi:hypothetical protein